MGPKRTLQRSTGDNTGNRASSSRQAPVPPPIDYDENKFVSKEAFDLFQKVSARTIVAERGFEYQNESVPEETYEMIRGEIQRRGWHMFADSTQVTKANHSLVYEFYANFPSQNNNFEVYARGNLVPTDSRSLNDLLDLSNFSAEDDDYHQLASSDDVNYELVTETLGMPGVRFTYKDGVPKSMWRSQLNQVARAWAYFVSARLLPSKHLSGIDKDRLLLVYAIMRGMRIDVGRIIRKSIKRICRLATSGSLGHGTFITDLCQAYEVAVHASDIICKPMSAISRTIVSQFLPPSLERPNSNASKRARDDEIPNHEEAREEYVMPNMEGPSTIPQPMDAVGPSSSVVPPSDDRLDILIQQNRQILQAIQYIVQERQAQTDHYNQYMRQRYDHDVHHIGQLNQLVYRWNLSEDNSAYFDYPPQYPPYRPPPPPLPF